MTVAVITSTSGLRPKCMEQLRRYMAAQTVQPDEWIIGDETDGSLPPWERPPPGKRRAVKERVWYVYKILMQRAVNAGHNKIIFMEDDDWYSPEYIQHRVQWLDSYRAVTGARALHFRVHDRAYRWITDNRKHEHVSQLAIRAEAVSSVLRAPRIEALGSIPRTRRVDHLVNIEVKAPDSLMGAVNREKYPWVSDPEARYITKFVSMEEVERWEEIRPWTAPSASLSERPTETDQQT